MIDVQREKAKHVTEHPHPRQFSFSGVDRVGTSQPAGLETPHGSTSSTIKDGAEGIRVGF